MKIFYSWQSGLPNKTNRGLIQDALVAAAERIGGDRDFDVTPVIDRDLQGSPGAPDIAASIFDKVMQSDVFVADVSIVHVCGEDRTPARTSSWSSASRSEPSGGSGSSSW